MVFWDSADRYDPPVIRNISTSVVVNYFEIDDPSEYLQLPNYPCHTQATERCIRLVTDASSAVIGEENRDGFIRARINLRAMMPNFNTKSEYNIL